MTSTIQKVQVGDHEIQLKHQLFLGQLHPLQSTNGREDLTGLKFWPVASTALLKKLEKNEKKMMGNHHETKHLRILELGAGCGLLGIGLAALYPNSQVVLTDAPVNFTAAEGNKSDDGDSSTMIQSTIQWLEGNIKRNSVLLQDRVSVAPLLWGDASEQMAITEVIPDVDLIVGAELLYNNEASFPGLIGTLQHFASAETRILLAYRERNLGEAQFFDLAKEHFSIEISRIGRKSDRIHLVELRLL